MSGWLLAAMIAAQSFDVGTTAEGFARGCVEKGHFLRQPSAVLGAKTAATATLTITLPMLHKRGRTKTAKGIALWAIAAGSVAGALNVRTLRKGC